MRASYFALVLALAGCAMPNIKPNYSLKEAQAGNQGLLIGSITTDTPYEGFGVDTNIFIETPRGTGGGSSRHLNVTSGCNLKRQGESDFPDVCGNFFAINLQAGTYYISMWNAGYGGILFGPAHWDVVPFTIRPGRATYVGNIHMWLEPGGKGLFGERTIGGGWPLVKDARARDIPLLQQRYPGIASESIDYDLLQLPLPADVATGTNPPPPLPVKH